MVELKSQKYLDRYYIDANDNESHQRVGRCYVETSASSYHLELWSLYVDASYRNKGLGTQLLQAAIAYAKKFQKQYKSNRSLVLYVYKSNERAISLYKRNGFEIIGDYRSDAYVMEYCA